MSTTAIAGKGPARNSPVTDATQAPEASAFDSVHYSADLGDLSLTPEKTVSQATSGATPKQSEEPKVTTKAPEKPTSEKILDVGASVGKYLGGWGVLSSAICEFFRGDDRGTGLARGAGTVAGGAIGLTAGSLAASAIVTGASYLAFKVGLSAAVAATPIGALGLAAGVGAYLLGGYLAGKGADLFQKWFGKEESKAQVVPA